MVAPVAVAAGLDQAALERAASHLARLLAAGGAARLGESAVASTRVHTTDAYNPGEVQVAADGDAGQVFYGRRALGEVLHLDVFHQVAEVEHRGVAAGVRDGIASFVRAVPRWAGGVVAPDAPTPVALEDIVDVQTATGGGRASGDLTYGSKSTLRRAHQNHVHLAVLRGEWVALLAFYLMHAVEQEVMRQGFEIRRLERVVMSRPGATGQADLSPYTTPSDSFLRARGPRGGAAGRPSAGDRAGQAGTGGGTGGGTGSGADGGTGGGTGAAGGGAAGGGAHSAAGGGAAKGGAQGTAGGGAHGAAGGATGGTNEGVATGGGAGGGAGGGGGTGIACGDGDGDGGDSTAGRGGADAAAAAAAAATATAPAPAAPEGPGVYGPQLADALELAGDLGGLDELMEVLREIKGGTAWTEGVSYPLPGAVPEAFSGWERQALLESLKIKGLVSAQGRRVVFTRAGEALSRYLDAYRDEVMRLMRRLARHRPRLKLEPQRGFQGNRAGSGRRGRRDRRARPAEACWPDQIAVAETVVECARRTWTGPGGGLALRPADLRFFSRTGVHPHDVCLLIDASASMAGRRLRAAKHLATHLLLATRDRVAVLAFQERGTRVFCPFTRDHRRVESGLRQLQAFGLTPLACGLMDGLEYLQAARARGALLFLITDGVPTIPKWSMNPIADSLQAAQHVARQHVPLACIGLEPNQAFLERLCAAAGGTLYVVQELERDVLVAIARRERDRAKCV